MNRYSIALAGLLALVLISSCSTFTSTKKPAEIPLGKSTDPHGMTWGVLQELRTADGDYSLASCYGSPKTDIPTQGCDIQHGDTSCKKTLPILCINKQPVPPPDGIKNNDPMAQWANATVRLSQPVVGTELTSRTVGDKICATRLGSDWQMAEFHDGANLGFWASGIVSQTERFWVAISDQPANCWN